MNLSPIVLFVYNRLCHARQTIEALQRNILATESELYIYSDAPKNKKDIDKVNEVRKYLRTIEGFKEVTIIERKENLGLANNIIDGVTQIINEFGKIIVIEDDLVTSPMFLKFMNEALEFYKNDRRIFAISGYTYPFKLPSNYNKDVFLFYRTSSWGWATWKDRWNKIDYDVKDYNKFLKNKTMQYQLKRGGEDLVDMLIAQMEGKLDSWAIRFAYNVSKFDGYCLYPVKSLLINIGHDGSGVHCGDSSKWSVSLDEHFFPQLSMLDIDEEIIMRLQKIFKRKFFGKLKRLIKCFLE